MEQRNICYIEEGLLHMYTEVFLISKHHAAMKFSLHIFEIMKVVDACRYHIVRMNHTLHFADSMEFIIIIMHSLRSIISLVRYSVRIVPLHDVSFDACVQANLYRFGINTAPSIAITTIFVDFFGKESCQFAPGVELMSAIRLG